ncbi:MAG: hypothetical protein PHS17_01015 [Desulfobacterales bacterium]|nr:hypothetical protein [Desulfobacterales bacterium]
MKIMMIGPGPDRIGKTGEWIRFALQAVRFFRKEGHEILCVDDSPVTLFNGVDGVRSYLEPLTLKRLEAIIEQEKPQAVVYAFGGCLATHLVIFLEREGVLDRNEVRVLGTGVPALKRYMDPEIFKRTVRKLGVSFMESVIVDNVDQCIEESRNLGFPLILRPSFALEGIGGYVVYNVDEVKERARLAFNLSPVQQVLLERAPAEWVQFALEAVHDLSTPGKVYMVGTMEALAGGVGVHPGNSLVISPAPSMRCEVLREAEQVAGLIAGAAEISGSFQVRFALSPHSGELSVLRVIHGLNRFSSLFSLRNHLPLPEINAGLSLGIEMVDLKERLGFRDLTEGLHSPGVVVRVPVFPEEFSGADIPDSTMRSTGAAVFLGQGIADALGKAVSFLEVRSASTTVKNQSGLRQGRGPSPVSADNLLGFLEALGEEKSGGKSYCDLFTGINHGLVPFLSEVAHLFVELKGASSGSIPHALLLEAKSKGLSDACIAKLNRCSPETVSANIGMADRDGFVTGVHTFEEYRFGPCFIAYGKTQFSTPVSLPEKTSAGPGLCLLLGAGPYRVGWSQEVEQVFYRTAAALQAKGVRLVVLDSNADGLLQDLQEVPICMEDVHLESIARVLDHWPVDRIIHQFCRELPDGLEDLLRERRVKILGTPLQALKDIRHTPSLWSALKSIGIPLLGHSFVSESAAALSEAGELGYPVLVRLTGPLLNPPGMIAYDPAMLETFLSKNQESIGESSPLLVTAYHEGMTNAEVLAVADGNEVGRLCLLEHVEEYGIHNGDCASVIPPLSLGEEVRSSAEEAVKRIVRHFHLIGHVQVDLAVRSRNIYVTGVWPYPGRNLPFAEKAEEKGYEETTAGLLLGEVFTNMDAGRASSPRRCFAKESTFPFSRFPDLSPVLSPRMQSTGQVIGIDDSFGKAYFKSQMGANPRMPLQGRVFVSVRDSEKEEILEVALKFLELGFSLVCTEGTGRFLSEQGLEVKVVQKISKGRPDIVDLIINGEISLVINIPGGGRSKKDEKTIHRSAIEHNIPLITTTSGAFLICRGIEEIRREPLALRPIGI